MSLIPVFFLYMIILVIFIIPGIGRQKNAGYRPAIIFPGFSAHDRMGISFFPSRISYQQEKISKASNQFKKSGLNYVFLENIYRVFGYF